MAGRVAPRPRFMTHDKPRAGAMMTLTRRASVSTRATVWQDAAAPSRSPFTVADDTLNRIRSLLRARLDELRPLVTEADDLARALDALDGARREGRPATSPARASRSRGSSQSRRTSSSPPRKRAARGANRQALLTAAAGRPGATAGELAQASGVSLPTAYNVLRKLVDDGEMVKVELPGGTTGYSVSEGTSETAA